jgi:hypothetical protein
MKREHWFLLCWVTFLVAIALFIMLPPVGSPTPGDAPSARPSTESPAPISQSAILVARNSLGPAGRAPSEASAGAGWPQWIEALRKAGVPDKVVADVVSADFESRWQGRTRAVQLQIERGEADDSALAQLHLQRSIEQERELRAALGEDKFGEWERDRLLRQLNLGNVKLTASETDALYGLRKGLEQRTRELDEARFNGEIDDIDYERQAEKNLDQYDREFNALIGNERYAATENTFGGGGGELRRALQQIKANGAQSEAILQAQQKWRDQRAAIEEESKVGNAMADGYEQRMTAIDAARDQEYQRALGEEGFAAFQKAQDHRYKAMKRYAGAWQLNEQDIDYLYRMQKHYESSVRDYRQQAQSIEEQGQPVDWSAVQAGIAQFSRETEQTLRSYLGEDRLKKLMRNDVVAIEK